MLHHFADGSAGVIPTVSIQSPAAWLAKTNLASDLSTYGPFVTANSDDHYTLGLGVGGCARMGEATGVTAWYDRAIFYLTGIMVLATPQAGGYLGWRSSIPADGGQEKPLYEIYCWRYATDLLRPLALLPAYASQFTSIKNFFEQNIWAKWYSRNGNRAHAVMHIGSHWTKIALYLATYGSTATIRSQAQGWLDLMDHGRVSWWNGKSIRTQLRAHPLFPGAVFWPSEFDEGDVATGSDVSHGEAIYTYAADAINANFGDWSLADVPRFLALKDVVWDTDAGVNWAYQIGPGSGTWSGKYSEMATFGQFDRAFQKQLEGLTVARNTELYGCCALNAARLGGPYL